MTGLPATPGETPPRCTERKHVQENGKAFCDCGAVMVGRTAAKNAYVVTLIDAVQAHGLSSWAKP